MNKKKNIKDTSRPIAYAKFHNANIGCNFLRLQDHSVFTKQQVFEMFYPATYRLEQLSNKTMPGWTKIDKPGWKDGEFLTFNKFEL
jgi:hypothetical protein